MKTIYKYFIRNGKFYCQSCNIKEEDGTLFIQNTGSKSNYWHKFKASDSEVHLETKNDEMAKEMLKNFYIKKLNDARKEVERFESIVDLL